MSARTRARVGPLGYLGAVHRYAPLLALLLFGCPAPSAPLVQVLPAAPTTLDTLVADVSGVEDASAWRLQWGRDGELVPDLDGSETVAAAYTAKNEAWQLAVTGEAGTWLSDEVVIANSPPSSDAAWIGPADASASSTLSISVEGWADDDGDAPGFVAAWTVDGEPVDGESGLTLAPGPFVRGSSVQAVVTPFDGDDEGAPLSTEPVLIGNSPPGAPTVAIEPAGALAGEDDLFCRVVQGQDIDGDPLTYAFAWSVEGRSYPDDVPGATGPRQTEHPGDTVPREDTAANEDWLCVVVANDGELDGPPGQASTRVVAGPATDFSLPDVNATSPRFGAPVSPRDYLQKVSGWYFGHAS